jgi:hypothetical protein
MSEPPREVQAALAAELKRQNRLQELGFTEDDFGQWKASGCRVTLYSVGGEYEIDIFLPNGSGVGFDVPFEKFHARTADEIRAARAAREGEEP